MHAGVVGYVCMYASSCGAAVQITTIEFQPIAHTSPSQSIPQHTEHVPSALPPPLTLRSRSTSTAMASLRGAEAGASIIIIRMTELL